MLGANQGLLLHGEVSVMDIFLLKCSVAFLFSYSSSLTNKYIREHFYSDEKINGYMYTGELNSFLQLFVCRLPNNRHR